MENETQIKPDFQALFLMVGEMKGTIEAMDKKLDANNTAICERVKECEGCIITQGNELANAKGRATVWGIVGGFISTIISAIIIWIITHQ